MASPGLSADPVLMAILKGLGGFVAGGIPGAFGGVIGGIEGAERAQRELTQADLQIAEEEDRKKFREKWQRRKRHGDPAAGPYADVWREPGREPALTEPAATAEQMGPPTELQYLAAGGDPSRLTPPPRDPREAMPLFGPGSHGYEEVSPEERARATALELPGARLGPGYVAPPSAAAELSGMTPQSLVNQATAPEILPSNVAIDMSAIVGPNGERLPGGLEGLKAALNPLESGTDEYARKKGFASKYDMTLGAGRYDPEELKGTPITSMTLDEVDHYQSRMRQHPDNGRDHLTRKGKSSAVGAIQIVRGTLRDVRKEMRLTGQEKFTPELQEQIRDHLLRTRTGVDDFVNGKLTTEEFLAKLDETWDGVLRDTPSARAPKVAPPPPPQPPFDPRGIANLPPEQRQSELDYRRAAFRTTLAEFGQARSDIAQQLYGLSEVGAGPMMDAAGMEEMAYDLVAMGNTTERSLGVGMLQSLQTRRTALGQAGLALLDDYNNTLLLADKEEYGFEAKIGASARIDAQKAANKYALIQTQHALNVVRDSERLAQDGNQKAALAEQRIALEEQQRAQHAFDKRLDNVPQLGQTIIETRKNWADLSKAADIIREGKAATGRVSGRLPYMTDARQFLNRVFLNLNADQIRSKFGGQPSVQESMMALHDLGASMRNNEDVNMDEVLHHIEKVQAALAASEAEYADLAGAPLAVDANSAFGQRAMGMSITSDVQAAAAGEEVSPEANINPFRNYTGPVPTRRLRERATQPVQRPNFQGRGL